MLENEIHTTNDGSHSLKNDMFNEMYHSEYGAIMESMHVYVNAGFRQVDKPQVSVYELGFGTGLNAFLTLLEAQKAGKSVYYEAVELYPISVETASTLNFAQQLRADSSLFLKLHTCAWNEEVSIAPYFTLKKIRQDIALHQPSRLFDVAYFDAFSCNVQPELWTENIFREIYNNLNIKGLLTTYSSKGLIKQAMRAAGFTVQRLLGAGGKRHMVRAVKTT